MFKRSSRGIYEKVFAGLALMALFATTLIACGGSSPNQAAESTTPATLDDAQKKIQHVVVIMQENRSFDHYFGTYPGADGIPMQDGVPTVCAPDPATGECVKPFHDSNDLDYGGPHRADDAEKDINGGKMDGFIQQERQGIEKSRCEDEFDPSCGGSKDEPSVMGYHDSREIPNYWNYAEQFVLQDHMFEPNASWSLPAHLFTVSGWSAKCSQPGDPMSCQNELQNTDRAVSKKHEKTTPEGTVQAPKPDSRAATPPDYAWTDLTYLLYNNDVSWAYYLNQGTQPDCDDGEMSCTLEAQEADVPGIWNPLPDFDTVKQDDQLDNVQDVSNF